MYNKVNYEVMMQILVELFMAALIFVNLVTGKINDLVHPKFNVMLGITIFILVLMAIFSIPSLFKPRHMNQLSKYFVMMIPLMVGFYINKDAFVVRSQGTNIVSNQVKPDYDIKTFEKTVYKKEPGKDYIEIDDDKYLKWYYDSSVTWDRYEDVKFKILVRVFKDPSQKDKFVVLGRMGMVCCMADMQPCGFIYNDKGYEKLKDNEWYWVRGRISTQKKFTYNYEELAQIKDVDFEHTRRPTDEYVYIQ